MPRSLRHVLVLGLASLLPACAWTEAAGITHPDPELAHRSDTDEQLYHKGEALFRQRRWKEAEEAFGRVWRDRKGSRFAADARFYEAECRYAREKWMGAFELYKSFIKDNPLSPHAATIERRLYDMGVYLVETGRGGFFDTSGEGVDVLEALVVAFPNGSLADDALLFIADHDMRQRRPQDAVNSLHDLVDRYPGSEWAFEGRLRLARAYRELNRGARYDADALRRAAAQYRAYMDIVASDPARAAEYEAQIAQARAELREVEEVLGRKGIEESDFYLYDGRVEAARAALRNVIRLYPETDAAAEARRRLGDAPKAE